MRQMLTNCPNCGGVLESNGYCPYCCTKVRYANEVDIEGRGGFNFHDQVELMFRVKKGDETVIFPVVGYFDTITMRPDHMGITDVYGREVKAIHLGTDVELHFTGRLIEEDRR